MALITMLLAGGWVGYTYLRYAKTQELFYPISGFIVADLYGSLMMAKPTAEFVLASL